MHYPECVDETVVEQVSRSTLEQNGFIVSPTAEFKKIDPTLMYELSAREQNRDKPIGYVEQGRFRIFSNAPTT